MESWNGRVTTRGIGAIEQTTIATCENRPPVAFIISSDRRLVPRTRIKSPGFIGCDRGGMEEESPARWAAWAAAPAPASSIEKCAEAPFSLGAESESCAAQISRLSLRPPSPRGAPRVAVACRVDLALISALVLATAAQLIHGSYSLLPFNRLPCQRVSSLPALPLLPTARSRVQARLRTGSSPALEQSGCLTSPWGRTADWPRWSTDSRNTRPSVPVGWQRPSSMSGSRANRSE